MNIPPIYFVLLLLTAGLFLYIAVLFFYFRSKAAYILLASFLSLISLGAIVEVGGQILGYFIPIYKSLPIIPDPVLGWKFLPNSQHTYTGASKIWYEREFSSQVDINSQGFRDFERNVKKEKNSVRIIVLGDSLVAAREVNFDKTAGQLLEKRLNEEFSEATGKKFEVLNFGGAGYGVEQIYLTWKKFAKAFKPDYVFVNVFDKNYFRTISNTWCQTAFFGLYGLKESQCLYIRPFPNIKKQLPHDLSKDETDNFILDYLYIKKIDLERIKVLVNNKKSSEVISALEKLPLSIFLPSDYDKFVERQKLYIEKIMGGKRINKTSTGFFLPHVFASIFKKVNSLSNDEKLRDEHNAEKMFIGDDKNFPTWLTTNLVNLKLFQALGGLVNQSGSRFIILDSFQYFSHFTRYMRFSSIWLEKLSQLYGFKYIPFYKRLNESRENGIPVVWGYDRHLNEKGNEIFADVMFNFLQSEFVK